MKGIGRKAAAAALAGCALLCGCRTSVNVVENADKSARPAYIHDARVVTDHSLEGKVVVASLAVAPSPSGLLRVQVTLLNRSNSIQAPYCLMEWVDEYAMKIDTASGGWSQQQLMPRESLPLTFIAPTAGAKDFRFKMMEDPK